jgi:predicted Holliday junction resolvase-like endonuclease
MNPTLGVLVLILAIFAFIIGIQKIKIYRLKSQLKDANKKTVIAWQNHANEREVSAKLDADLKQADIEYDALSEELNGSIKAREIEHHHKQVMQSVHLAQMKIANDKRDEWHNKYLDVRGENEELIKGIAANQEHHNTLIEKLDAANNNFLHAAEGAVKYHDLIAMPRRKRDKFISQFRRDNGIKPTKQPIESKEGLVAWLTVKNPTQDEAKQIFELAKEFGISLLGEKLPIKAYPWLWYAGDMIMRCASKHTGSETYVTASEFMRRMRNHVNA